MEDQNQSGSGGDFTSIGIGALVALVLLAVVLRVSGIYVTGWIRFIVIVAYVLLLALCTWVTNKIRGRKK